MKDLLLSQNTLSFTNRIMAWDIPSKVWTLKVSRSGDSISLIHLKLPRLVVVARHQRGKVISTYVAAVRRRGTLSGCTKLYHAPLLDVDPSGQLSMMPISDRVDVSSNESVITKAIENHVFTTWKNSRCLRKKYRNDKGEPLYWSHLDYLTFFRKGGSEKEKGFPSWCFTEKPETLKEFLFQIESGLI